MDDRTTDNHGSSDNHGKPPRRDRRQRPNGRWTDPATPLQAARFELRKPASVVIRAIHAICEGHNGRPCRLDLSKISEYETGKRRPSIEHMTALCRYYQKSPEELGFITWRDVPADPTSSEPPDTGAGVAVAKPESESPSAPRAELGAMTDKQQAVMDWLVSSGATLAAAVLKALTDYPVKPSS